MGAVRGQILWMFLRQTLTMVALGTAAGLIAALGTQKLISSLLFGVDAADIAVYATATTSLVIVAMLASVAPAWRAARSDPAKVLRED
jgi:putative ABC transport system permease protein